MPHRDAPGMRGDRARTKRGPLRRKRGDTRIRTLEREYEVDFGVRGDMRLDNYLKRTGAESLKDALDRL